MDHLPISLPQTGCSICFASSPMSVQDCSVQPQKRSLFLSSSTYIRLNDLDRAGVHQSTSGREYLKLSDGSVNVSVHRYTFINIPNVDRFRATTGFSFYPNVIMSAVLRTVADFLCLPYLVTPLLGQSPCLIDMCKRDANTSSASLPCDNLPCYMGGSICNPHNGDC